MRVRDFAEFALGGLFAYMAIVYFLGASEAVARIDDPVLSSAPGVPSVGTIAAILASVLGFKTGSVAAWLAVSAIGLVGMLGYLCVSLGLTVDAMIFHHPRWSTAMAFPTAAALACGGAAGVRMARRRSQAG